MEINKLEILGEIKGFLEGYNNELKYLVHVETNPSTNIADCIVHPPKSTHEIHRVKYQPFIYMKDLSLCNMKLYAARPDIIENKKIQYGIQIIKLVTGKQKRLINGFCYKIISNKSFNDIISFLKDGGINPYEKMRDEFGNFVKTKDDDYIFLNRDYFYSPKLTEQFLISTKSRLFKGYDEYHEVYKITFDIETTGLRHQISRIFAIGIKDNRDFETILEVDIVDDDCSEKKIIEEFFEIIAKLRPAIICGFNSEEFDFHFIMGRAKELEMDIPEIIKYYDNKLTIKRKPNVPVKYGNSSDRYTATEIWGMSIIDILHAVKRTSAVNSDIKENGLKYISKYENLSKENRTYIDGEDNMIGKIYYKNNLFLINENNKYIQIPDNFQGVARDLLELQLNKDKYDDIKYNTLKKEILDNNSKFINWVKQEALPDKMTKFINGKNLVKQYLLDDLWETEQVDELYNQSSFILAKLIPTTYQRICTMGTAGIWNLLLTAWSYENDLAIPDSDENEKYVGGLSRCYKSGYLEKIVKIDYNALYPMIQLSDDVFPIFDISGVMKKMLLYLTTTRNIYKRLGNNNKLNNDEITLLRQIDHEMHEKYINNEINANDVSRAKIKQLPIKILNNSLYGALGSGVSFNWSDNLCATRITCTARLYLRRGVFWFKKFGLIPLLAVTDGINFKIPNSTKIRITNDGVVEGTIEGTIEEMWNYGGKRGVAALIEKYNEEEMPKPFMGVDNDGEALSCLNLARINYATLSLLKNKKTGELYEKIKLTGNTIKSKTMSEYIEEFFDVGLDLILHGKGYEFYEYYKNYVIRLYNYQIPLKKIASKNRIKSTISSYKKRGKDKNGRDKARQAHMELLIMKQNKIVNELFEKHKNEFILLKPENKMSTNDKMKFVVKYMQQEPELDSYVYYVNTGYRKSHGDSSMVKDEITNEERFCSILINNEDLNENPNMLGKYNIEKYLDSFNTRISTILVGFQPEIREKMLAKIEKVKTKDISGKIKIKEDLVLHDFLRHELNLESFDIDDLNESYFLEQKEIEFWNKTGYDPKKIWNDLKVYDDDKLHYEIYQYALNYLNNKMTENHRPRIKSVNDRIEKGDFVLFKNNKEYSVGYNNGNYIEIVKETVEIPKSEYELFLDEIELKKQEKIENLELGISQKTEKEVLLEKQNEKRIKYFELFKRKYNLPIEVTIEQIISEIENVIIVLDNFIVDEESIIEDGAKEYIIDDYYDN